jgi:hypothetical protein
MKYISLFLLLSLGACSQHYLGKVGDTKYYSLCDERLVGPNINALVSEKDNKAHLETVFSGPGIITSVGATAISVGTPLGAAYIEARSQKITTESK